MHLAPSIPHLDRLLHAARTGCRAFEQLRSLCDDVGPRFPCTPGDVAAIAWAQEAMRGAGLASVRAEAAPATLWERGDESCTLLLPRRQPAVLTALGGSVGTAASGIDAEVIEFGSLEALDA